MKNNDTNEMIRAATETVARQFVEANRQEQQWLRDEINNLRAMLWAAAYTQPHGELKIPVRDLSMYRRHDSEIECYEDKRDRAYIVRAVIPSLGEQPKQ